mmetsp:Transcript_8657/g.25892  ORF Transcript_8657/g.25892 Transcript_8657/m.25892 type:complete len:278 (+) Transcript_8657:548-1381(+)
MPASRVAAAWLLLLARTDALLHTPSFYGVAADTSNLATPSFYGAAAGQGGAVDAPENRPLMIGVAGGTASGKTALTAEILRKLEAEDSVAAITQDSFYRDLTKDELQRIGEINFDVPSAFDFEECHACLRQLSRGQRGVHVPRYDFVANARRPAAEDEVIPGAPRIVIFEGILALYDAKIRDLLDLKIFVDADADVRLARRLARDVADRGRDVDGVLRQYTTFVKPAFDEFVLPTKRWADVVVPRGAENHVAIDLLVRGIRERTLERSVEATGRWSR